MIVSPAGSGKTFIAAGALAKVIGMRARTAKVRVGWIANTLEQVAQGESALSKFESIREHALCVVGCPASFPDGLNCDVLIVDECQHSGSESWSKIIDEQAGAVWFFSATPFGEDEDRNERLRDMTDHNIHVVPRSAVAARVLPAEVRMQSATDEPDILQAEINEEIEQQLSATARRVAYGAGIPYLVAREQMWPKVAFRVCLQLGIAANGTRNGRVVRLAKQHQEDYSLILVNTVDHGKLLAEKIPGSVVCHSKMGKRARRDAMDDFRAGKLRVIIGTSLLDEGADLPRANVLIMAAGGRSAGRTEQRTGRVLRVFDDQTRGIIYDFTDPQHPLLASQSRKRQAVYRQLGYTVIGAEEPQQKLFS